LKSAARAAGPATVYDLELFEFDFLFINNMGRYSHEALTVGAHNKKFFLWYMVYYYSETMPALDRIGILLVTIILTEADQIDSKLVPVCGFNLLDQILN
jgi:hypothetical protein